MPVRRKGEPPMKTAGELGFMAEIINKTYDTDPGGHTSISKWCSKCKRVRLLSDFHKNKSKKDGYCRYCAECTNKYATEYRRKHQDQINSSRLKCTFGITQEDYDLMLEMQEDTCAICGKALKENGKLLCVDHDHKTGEVRGLLCDNCNWMLGNAFDNPQILINGAEYLETFLDRHKKEGGKE